MSATAQTRARGSGATLDASDEMRLVDVALCWLPCPRGARA